MIGFIIQFSSENNMRFLVQKIDGKIVHDFAFEMQQAKKYYDWSGKEKLIIRYIDGVDFSKIKNPDWYVPIGTVEFVSAYLNTFYPEAKKSLLPLNVPIQLFQYAGRDIANREEFNKEIVDNVFDPMQTVFMKSNDKIKDYGNGLCEYHCIPDGNWQISEQVDIVSEWRVFVFNGEIQHISNYSGDCMWFPDSYEIHKMVEDYKKSPKAYTLDVAVIKKSEDCYKTVIIEAHRFFSCGLYGFSDHARIPKMFSQCWNEMKRMR